MCMCIYIYIYIYISGMYKARHGLDLARKKRHGTVFGARNGFETRHGMVRPGTDFFKARHGTVFSARFLF